MFALISDRDSTVNRPESHLHSTLHTSAGVIVVVGSVAVAQQEECCGERYHTAVGHNTANQTPQNSSPGCNAMVVPLLLESMKLQSRLQMSKKVHYRNRGERK